ncbi:MAG: class I SAM-dependent methyltransferase [Blastocatellia bacterium]|nr:class I SAM-dependent methyltransferase [Blastocatellia bacterium]
MGIYSKYCFPFIMDLALSSNAIARYRQNLLLSVKGDILEIGFGTGLNVANYPKSTEKIVTIDSNEGMNSLAKKRIQTSKIEVEHHTLTAETLPFADQTFDTVVSTWTLCSISNVDQALVEIHRVLKVGGQFLFLEHSLSNEKNVQVWQNRLNSLEKIIADGCHLNRHITNLVAKQPWQISEEKQFYISGVPKILGYMYQGVAIKKFDKKQIG